MNPSFRNAAAPSHARSRAGRFAAPFAALPLLAAASCGQKPAPPQELAAAAGALGPGAASLVADIAGPLPPGTALLNGPKSLVDVDGTLFFVGTDARHGTELWKTDGTSAGTVLVKDIWPGAAGSSPSQLVNADGTLFFTADDGSHGFELWKSDGTAAGTVLVKDVFPGPNNFGMPSLVGYHEYPPGPRWLAAARGNAYFAMNDGVHGIELWRSDGTEAGTLLLKDIAPGPAGANVMFPAAAAGAVYFRAADGLWKTDGTPAGTASVKATGAIMDLTGVGGALYYRRYQGGTPELWRSDGTAAGSVVVATGVGGNRCAGWGFLDFNGKVFYGHGDSVSLHDPATNQSTLLLSGACTGTWNPSDRPVVVGDRVYFTGTSGDVWSSDGTAAGTVVLRRFATATYCTAPTVKGSLGATLFLSLVPPTGGGALWKSDGTAAGTVQVGSPAVLGDSVCTGTREMVASNGRLFFPAAPPGTVNYARGQVELWATDGTADGTFQVSHLADDRSSRPAWLADLGGTLLFGATTAGSGAELWRSDGTAAGTQQVADLSVLAPGSTPARLVARGDRVFFDASNGYERGLYATDGTPSGTTRLARLPAAAPPENVGPLALVGDTLFFGVYGYSYATGRYSWSLWRSDGSATGTGMLAELAATPDATMAAVGGRVVFPSRDAAFYRENFGPIWSSDGTAAGTVKLVDGTGVPLQGVLQSLAPLADKALFQVWTSLGPRLWRTDGTLAGTALVVALAAGPVPTFPASAGAAGGRYYFAGYSAATGYELWTSDGTAAGTRLVKDIHPGVFGSNPVALTDLNGTLHFAATDGAHGYELWKSDGTADGTVMVGDIHPGAPGGLGAGARLLAVPAEGRLVFAATDGTAGMEPWSSDGTPEGTGPLGDINPGPDSSNPSEFAVSGGRVFFQADDGTHGAELWSLPLQARPLTIACPARESAEATSPAGAVVTLLSAAASGGTGIVTTSLSPASGSLFPLGETTVTATARDSAATEVSCRFQVEVRDTTAPALACPSVLQVEATSPTGAIVALPEVVATDAVSTPARTYSPASGSRFSLGSTAVTVTAQDAAGNQSTCTFPVVVADATAPALTCPADLNVEATSPAGARVGYAATASDLVSAPQVDHAPASGSELPLGVTTATATATDAAGNRATCTFRVTVADTTAPAVKCPPDSVFEATSGAGARVEYEPPSATDAISTPRTSVSVPPESLFPLGDTPVVFTAVDEAGNRAECTFVVTVEDSTAPAITCPGDRTVEATSPAGARVAYPAAMTIDAVSAAPATYSHKSDSDFPLGVTTVRATATDAAGNTARCEFRIAVVDTVAPALTCPGNLVAEAAGPTGAAVAYEIAEPSDAVTEAPALVATPASGSVFPLGSTPVTVAATDTALNAATCSFTVSVVDSTAPALSCPADRVFEAASAAGASVSWEPAQSGDAVSTPTLAYSTASGSLFALGSHAVTVTATDAAHNRATCAFTVTVADTVPPTIACPEPLTTEATGPEGAIVAWAPATAADAVSDPAVEYTHPAMTRFPLGATTVGVTATDAAGNSATCSFAVTVNDTTPPALAAPADLQVEATSADGATVRYPAVAAVDLVSPASVAFEPPDGSVLPLGTTTVAVTATDAAGNATRKSFEVAVGDTTAPTIKCPADVSAAAPSPAGAEVSFAAPDASDAVTARPAVSTDPPSGALFPVGGTSVAATARDEAGNSATCAFTVAVSAPEPAPPSPEPGAAAESGCGCSGSATPWAALLLALTRGRRRARLRS